MQLLKMDKPQCLLYSFAMVIDEDPAVLIEEIGATGLEVWWPAASGNKKLRGHHPQELIDCCAARGHFVGYIEAMPNMAAPSLGQPRVICESSLEARLEAYMEAFDGVLTGTYNHKPHATAWNADEQICYDPNGIKYDVDDFCVREFWPVVKADLLITKFI